LILCQKLEPVVFMKVQCSLDTVYTFQSVILS